MSTKPIFQEVTLVITENNGDEARYFCEANNDWGVFYRESESRREFRAQFPVGMQLKSHCIQTGHPVGSPEHDAIFAEVMAARVNKPNMSVGEMTEVVNAALQRRTN